MRIVVIHRLKSWSRLGIIERGSEKTQEGEGKTSKGGTRPEKKEGDNKEIGSSLGRQINK